MEIKSKQLQNISFWLVGIIIGGIITAYAGYHSQKLFKKYEIGEINKPILMLGQYIDVHQNQGEKKVFLDYTIRNNGQNLALKYQVIIGTFEGKEKILLKGHSFESHYFCGIVNNPFTVEIRYGDVFDNYYSTRQKVYLEGSDKLLKLSHVENLILANKINGVRYDVILQRHLIMLGLIFNFIGAAILFMFANPYRSVSTFLTLPEDEQVFRDERTRLMKWQRRGFFCIALGFFIQLLSFAI